MRDPLMRLLRYLLDGRSVAVAPCPGCGVPPGWCHVPGCPRERCPACGATGRCDCTGDARSRRDPIPWDGAAA